jgi:hypothetical protein
MDLSVPTNIPTRWVDAGTSTAPVPPSAPVQQSKTQQHTRKKNV